MGSSSMAKHILLVDDDALFRRSLAFNLEQAGYRASTAGSAEEGLMSARANTPDLVLLDINLPGMDGLDALRVFQNQLHIPVIFLTARHRELEEALGMELGADDYITKPFNFDVLVGHVKAVLRRTAPLEGARAAAEVMTVGDLVINPAAHTVTRAEELVELTPR